MRRMDALQKKNILEVMRSSPFVVEATIGMDGPQAAVIGVVVTDDLEVFFDTLSTSRKYENLRRSPKIAFVMWSEARTVQYEGIIDEPTAADLARLKAIYLKAFPDGVEREKLADTVYVRARARWVRYSDFATPPPTITEHTL
jgi:uncharacterized pyridoxamine 5'-phosphate oxidase family protein